jgi:hypothetical protein
VVLFCDGQIDKQRQSFAAVDGDRLAILLNAGRAQQI